MKALRRIGLIVGFAAVALAVCVWYVYGEWPVPEGYEFPRHSLWGGGPAAAIEGTLVDREGCILVGNHSVVWPPCYSLAIDDGEPIVRGGGQDVPMGEEVLLSGGEYGRKDLESVAPGAATTRCPEPFWLTTGFVD